MAGVDMVAEVTAGDMVEADTTAVAVAIGAEAADEAGAPIEEEASLVAVAPTEAEHRRVPMPVIAPAVQT